MKEKKSTKQKWLKRIRLWNKKKFSSAVLT